MQPDEDKRKHFEDLASEKKIIETKKKWRDYPIKEEIIDILELDNLYKPTKIQANTLGTTLDQDRKALTLLIKSMTGTGKTHCFIIPILNSLDLSIPFEAQKQVQKEVRGKKVVKTQKVEQPQAVVVVNSMHLLTQIKDIFVKLLSRLNPIWKKKHGREAVVGKCDADGHETGHILVIVAGSFKNKVFNRNQFKLNQLKWLVFDQADDIQKYQPNYIKEMIKQIKAPKAKFILCSATLDKRFMEKMEDIVDRESIVLSDLQQNLKQKEGKIVVEGITEYYQDLKGANRAQFVLQKILVPIFEIGAKCANFPQIIIFFNRIQTLQDFFAYLQERRQNLKKIKLGLKNIKIKPIHSKLSYEEKSKVMAEARNNEVNVLLATDAISRGIDIRTVTLIINYEAPVHNKFIDIKTYFHRIGRTGRYTDIGVALTLLDSATRVGDKNEFEFLALVKKQNPKSKIEQIALQKEQKDVELLWDKIKQSLQHNMKD